MTLLELLLISVGLSMDAFAVALCKGLSIREFRLKKALVVGLYFGGFQAAMPLLGYVLGVRFAGMITAYDHWIAFILLAFIGGRMIKESVSKKEMPQGSGTCEAALEYRNMVPLALATSVDALAVGISLAFLQVRIIPAVSVIGLFTLVLSMVGVKLGTVFGVRFQSKAELGGGVILVLMGTKILLEHTGVIG